MYVFVSVCMGVQMCMLVCVRVCVSYVCMCEEVVVSFYIAFFWAQHLFIVFVCVCV